VGPETRGAKGQKELGTGLIMGKKKRETKKIYKAPTVGSIEEGPKQIGMKNS